MKNAVIYARYSSHGQNEQTIDGQIRVCKEYAQHEKLNIVGTYIDKHRTGTDVNRPQFQRMIEDSKLHKFDYIIVYMLDRFARNRYYSTIYNYQLNQNGVKVVSASENISESEEGEFYQMFLEWQAERYSKKLSKRVTEGITTSVKNGTAVGGWRIYGYKKDGKRWIIDEDESEVVRFIFEQYVAGVPKRDIVRELTECGVRNAMGKPFSAAHLDRLLSNERYTGTYICGGRVSANTYARIIDDQLFAAAQERAAANRHFSGKNSAKVDYLLSGKIFCGKCGAAMVASGGYGKSGKRYYYYACREKLKTHKCDLANLKKDEIESFVVDYAVEYLSDRTRVQHIADRVIAYYKERSNASEIKRIKDNKARVQREIDNAVNMLLRDDLSKTTIAALDAKVQELTQQLEDLSTIQTKLELENSLNLTKSDIIEFVKMYISGASNDESFKRRIIDNLVNSVHVYDDFVIVFFNVGNTPDSPDNTRVNFNEHIRAELSSNFNPLAPPRSIMQ